MGFPSRRLSKDERNSYRDEQRLLPGSQPKRDRGAIPIQPGSSTKKYENFKPTNTIGVRPGTRVNQVPSTSRPSFTTPKPSRLDRSTVIPDSDDEDTTPPRKRLKRDSPEIIDLEGNDQPLTIPKSPSADILIDNSPPQTPVREKKSSLKNTSKYWPTAGNAPKTPSPVTPPRKLWSGNMRDVLSGPDDEQPANQTKHEQVRSTGVQNIHASKNSRSTLGIPAVVVKLPDAETMSKYPKENSSLGGDDQRCHDSRDSPDELQGNTTISDAWKERDTFRRDVSPSNIRHSGFITESSQKSLSRYGEKKVKKKQALVTFDISMLRYQGFLAKPLSRLAYNKDTSKFLTTSAGDTLLSKAKTFDFMKAIRMYYSEHAECGKVRLIFPQSQGMSDEFADIEFSSEAEKKKFWDVIHKGTPSLKRHKKEKKWMENLFQQSANTVKLDTSKLQKPKSIGTTKESSSPNVKPKRVKLSDNLGNGDQPVSKCAPENLSHAHPSPSRPELNTSMSLNTCRIPPITRSTRSSTRKQNLEIDSDDEDEKPTSTSIFDVPGKRWQNPLVYPATGKKKAEVEAHDLDRLRPHEFLNDNLIGLYIRFLEHHLERQHPDFAKRVYFFNSYFFATLTNTSKSQKGINYQGVEKWTRSFDIFGFDYLVVPINENAHWYVAIICNLPNLLSSEVDDGLSGSEDASQQEVPTIPDTSEVKSPDVPSNITAEQSKLDTGKSGPSGSEAANEGQIQESFTSMTLDDNVSGESKEVEAPEAEWPDEDENQPSSPIYGKKEKSFLDKPLETPNPSSSTQLEQASKTSKAVKKRGKKNRAPYIRYDVKQPAIIVFDSLDCPRRPTIGILRDYLQEEAQSKRSLTIDSKEIVGMNAKQIPHQPNFSDCGLYLLAYLEKFVRNPDTFVKSVLRREMNRNKDWPAMKPGLFRSRLRTFLLDLYEEQEALKNGKLKENDPLMADTKSLNILLDNTPAEDDSVTDEDKKGSDRSNVTPEPKIRRAVSETQVTPTRSSPCHNRKVKDIPRSSSPKLPGTIIIPPSHNSTTSNLRGAAPTKEKSRQNETTEEEDIQVPMTPPPASPSVVVSSPVGRPPVLARSKRSLV